MKKLIVVFLSLYSFVVFPAIYQAQIESIDLGEDGAPHLLLLSDGHVAFLDQSDKSSLSLLKSAQEKLQDETWVEVEVDEAQRLLSIKTTPPMPALRDAIFENDIINEYTPSVTSYENALLIFKKMRKNYQNNSQCYNRAHIWSYEEFRRSSFRSMKLFLFFTTKYIRAFRYHWWFHVAPMTYVGDSSYLNWYILDRRFTKKPHSLQNWTDIFMRNKASCKIVDKYNDYRDHQQSQWCYLIPVSMYYWQPRDILRRDTSGVGKNQFIQGEINHAYWEAF
jgi:hypothetical protein